VSNKQWTAQHRSDRRVSDALASLLVVAGASLAGSPFSSASCALHWGSYTNACGAHPLECRYHSPFCGTVLTDFPVIHQAAIPLSPFLLTSLSPTNPPKLASLRQTKLGTLFPKEGVRRTELEGLIMRRRFLMKLQSDLGFLVCYRLPDPRLASSDR
jgi:hypothetical protein